MSSEASVSGVITHIHSNHFDGWRAGRIRTSEDSIAFAGTCDCELGDSWTLHGSWSEYKGRPQLAVAWATRNMVFDKDGIQKILEKDPRFKLIGPIWSGVLAKAAEDLGGDLSIILSDPEKTKELKRKAEAIRAADVRRLDGPDARSGKIPRKAIRFLKEQWESNRVEHETKATLIGLGLSPRQVDQLWKNLGTSGQVIIWENPWAATTFGVPFETIDAIALEKLKFDRIHPKRLEAGIVEALNALRRDGHTWIARSKIVDRTKTTLSVGRIGDREAVARVLEELIAAQDDRLALSVLEPIGEIISPRDLYVAETTIAHFFDRAQKDDPNPHFVNHPFDPRELAWLIKPDHKGVTRMPNEAQTEAILKATLKKKVVITGPAGVGKSTLIASLLRVYQSRSKNVLLAAPTGKAAKRLFDVMNNAGELDRPLPHEPATIHRLLKCKGPGVWEENPLGALPVDALIVDEAGMIESEVMSRVVRALPLNCALILVGDTNQLPPVGPGAVFRDLVDGDRCEVARLDKVMRHAGVMRVNARAVLSGVMTGTTQEVDENGPVFDEAGNPVIPWIVEDRHKNPETAKASIAKRFEKLLLEGGRRSVLELQVLSPQYDWGVGINNLNRTLQRIAQRILYGNEIEPEADKDGKVKYREGDKVVQIKNDYEINLMNGMQGIVVGIGSDAIDLEIERVKGRPTTIRVPRAAAEGLRLAWCVSIHRFQGDQAEHVIAACHSEHMMLNRKLVYTAATRATKTVALIGDQGGLRGALMKTDTDFRRTFMAPPALLERFAREAGVKRTAVS
jgi:exodeoxyribonuclease V alpha subunit